MAAEQEDTPMTNTNTTNPTPSTSTSTSTTPRPSKPQKSHELAACTIRSPPYSYAHLELLSSSSIPPSDERGAELDALQVRSYCTAALKQFLGVAGTAIPVDILKVDGRSCWLRVPREDLGAFAAAITAWQGVSLNNGGGGQSTFRIRGCSDWLGMLVGGQGEERLWTG